MASNSFGQVFRITTFGESHGKAVGVVIDGCPSNLELDLQEIQNELDRRRPGTNNFVSPRKEADKLEILSGIFEGKTTGAPIAILIPNIDGDSSQYSTLKDVLRPGHANYSYLQKYGIFDYRGGGRASARETAARVAAGAVAKQFLLSQGIRCRAYLSEVGGIIASDDLEKLERSSIFCPCPQAEEKILRLIEDVKNEGDSIGGIVACIAKVPPGLGDPVYEKLEAKLASSMLSIPASKGFEVGLGFEASRMKGSQHNDAFTSQDGKAKLKTNHAGGMLGGISTGENLYFRVAFKPTSTILKSQESVSLQGDSVVITPPNSARHDPCVAIRAVPVVEAMCALVLADALLLNRLSQREFRSCDEI